MTAAINAKREPLTDEERAIIAEKYPSYTVDKEGYYTSKTGKRIFARQLTRISPHLRDRPDLQQLGVDAAREKGNARWDKYLEQIAKGVRPSVAASKGGFTMRSVYQRRGRDEHFVELEKEARIRASEPVVDALFESAMNGNFQAQNKILESYDPEMWRHDKTIKIEQNTIEISSGDLISRIGELMARIEERKALTTGVLDVEAFEPDNS
jgi:hypothetical protein